MKLRRVGRSPSGLTRFLLVSALAHSALIMLAWTFLADNDAILQPLISVTLISDFQLALETQSLAKASESHEPARLDPEPLNEEISGAANEAISKDGEIAVKNESNETLRHMPDSEMPVSLATTSQQDVKGKLPGSLSLIAAIAESQRLADNYSGNSRVGRLLESDELGTAERFYLDAWVRKVTRIGKMNYPSEAVAAGVHGRLQILAIVEADGSLANVRIFETSGHEVLDKAAIRIVRLAAPYAPFPPVLRQRFDRLEIVRGWEFRDRDPLPDA